VEDDDNCLYRGISLLLFGTQVHHLLIRLFLCHEMISNRHLYDREYDACNALLNSGGKQSTANQLPDGRFNYPDSEKLMVDEYHSLLEDASFTNMQQVLH
jgi:hypothetical protein